MKFDKTYYTTRNYRDYLGRRFDDLAEDNVVELGLEENDRIVDFGCGYGGLVNSLLSRGFSNVVGTDISYWAIEYGREQLGLCDRLQHFNKGVLESHHEWTIVLDVLEHVPEFEIDSILQLAYRGNLNGMLVRIPVSLLEGEPFVLAVSNNDPTHITCHTKGWWFEKFIEHGWLFNRFVQRSKIYDSEGVLVAVLRKDSI